MKINSKVLKGRKKMVGKMFCFAGAASVAAFAQEDARSAYQMRQASVVFDHGVDCAGVDSIHAVVVHLDHNGAGRRLPGFGASAGQQRGNDRKDQ